MSAGARHFSVMPVASRRQRVGQCQVSGGTVFYGAQHHLANAAGRVRQLEQRAEAVLAAKPDWRVRGFHRHAGEAERLCPSRPGDRFDFGPRLCLCSRRQREQDGQALERSGDGFSTNIHLKTDFDGHFLAFDLTGGEKGYAPHLPILLGIKSIHTTYTELSGSVKR